MSADDPLSPDGDPFGPPAISTIVCCLHCNEEYDSYRIEWRIETDAEGRQHGFWCCPIEGCDGKGFGFDLLPIDPYYRDENGGWAYDDEDEDDEEVEQELYGSEFCAEAYDDDSSTDEESGRSRSKGYEGDDIPF